ncbi:MAG: SRPBCC family protein [Chloroflexota bacterium]
MAGVPGSIVRLAILGAVGAWLADRWLRERAAGPEPPSIRTSIEIDAPIERAWAVLADIERQPEWMHDLKSVEVLTPPPIGVGTRAVGRVRAFGIDVEDPIEITAFEPPVRYSIRHDGFVGGVGDIRLVNEGGRDGEASATLVTWDETLVPRVLPHLGALVIALVFRPIFERDLERLAGLVEAEA